MGWRNDNQTQAEWNEIQANREKVTILTTEFSQFQKQVVAFMKTEDDCFKELKTALKEIQESITKSQKENERLTEHMRVNLISLIDKEYTSKLDMEKYGRELREQFSNDMESERKRATREIWLVLFGFTMAMGIVAWVIANFSGIIPHP